MMNRKMNIVTCLLLVITLLSGCSANNRASAENSSALEETAPTSSIETTKPEESEEAIPEAYFSSAVQQGTLVELHLTPTNLKHTSKKRSRLKSGLLSISRMGTAKIGNTMCFT